MEIFEKIKELLQQYTYDFIWYGWIKMVIDVVCVFVIVVWLFIAVRTRVKVRRVIECMIIIGLIFVLCYVFEMQLLITLLKFLLFWSFGVFLLVYGQEIKHMIDNLFSSSKVDNSYTSKQEQQHVISTLVQTVGYLSKRKIGALITIERDDNLNNYIDKAIEIKAILTQEILTTIFTPGTACHDGAVIIRKNRIMCAGAYFPSTDKYDIPKFLGTRHRAAIGISERCDAITIIVSEETGNISVTIDGVINLELSFERLEEMLERYLVVK